MWIDFIFVIFVIVYGMTGYFKGFFSQAWSIGAIFLSYLLPAPILSWCELNMAVEHSDIIFKLGILKTFVGFIIYFVLLFIGKIVGYVLIDRYNIISSGNKYLGACISSLKGVALSFLIIWTMLFLFPSFLSEESSVNISLRESSVASIVAPYSPFNLLLLPKLYPYFPKEAVTSVVASSKKVSKKKLNENLIPEELSNFASLKDLINDKKFLSAYNEKEIIKMLMSSSFHKVVSDKELLYALEKIKD